MTAKQKVDTEAEIDYHFITVREMDGSEYITRSTYGKEGDVYVCEVDRRTHPAWTGGKGGGIRKKKGRRARFEDKFKGLFKEEDDA